MFGAFFRRDWLIAVSYRAAFGLELLSVLSNLALLYFLGRVVDAGRLSERAGLHTGYFAFAALGVALVGVFNTGLTAFSERVRQDQLTGTFEVLMMAPAPTSLLIMGSAAYEVVREALLAVLTVGLAAAIFSLRLNADAGHALLAVLALTSCVVMFAGLGVAVAAFTVLFKKASALVQPLTAALSLLAGVYFPLSVLPQPLRGLADALPLSWALDVLRACLLGGDVDDLRLVLMLGATVAAIPAGLWCFELSMRRARRLGTVGHY